ncbi:MAG: HPr(Ser) kinase/phosphatase [Prosthecobacter sp.]|jgi:HPr kinase/phosphorylase|uniref:HPr(Ser) kinase/phosphatase n=1 Tax=Prosthecobacter sp. TaxID=1965333 RepID=UPI0019DB5E2E|nr:HPr(Ser) kinase/phosphatase [Prosthecobacter sp.]MBE2285555.1 HPr(Ser) kinase/phosphatase [Prosthecobacter sp.]
MPPPPKVKRPSSVTVGEFFQLNDKALKLRLIGSDIGFTRKISEPSVNRPGLALSGFFTYFAYKRVQVIGNSEHSFLEGLEPRLRAARFSQLCSWDIPCIIVARGHRISDDLVEIANAAGISIFQTSMVTMKFLNVATIKLEWTFAPSLLVHGCMVDVQGIGVLIQGDSGCGKSESVIGLLQRGASLVADDAVRLRLVEDREIIGSAPDLTRGMIEIRGLGILNVAALFGVGAVRLSKRLDFIVELVRGSRTEDLERVGVTTDTREVMGLKVERVALPVEPGRDVAGLIELAAMNYKLRAFGHNSAVEFDQRLLKKMSDDQLG